MTTSAQETSEGTRPQAGGAGQWNTGKSRMLAAIAALLAVAALTVGAWAMREGTVRLESIPTGAEVFVDGNSLGVTPLTISTRFSARVGTAEFRLSGHQALQLPLKAEPGDNSILTARLLPTLGSLEVHSSPEGADVFVDDVRIGVTPLVMDGLSPAQHSVRVHLANHREWSQQVSVVATERANVAATLEALPGLVTLVSEPAEATVWLDGTERGVTPLRLESLIPGEHLLKLSKADYEDWIKTVQVGPGENPELKVALQRPKPAAAPLERPIAVMIDNHPDARPQSGLSSADIVYEAIAEGGVTRYMGIFASRPAETVGPVRSARHYFVHWADEYNAMFVHCGGYPEAYAAIENTGIADFDDLKGSPGFWRSDERPAPHNLYASIEELRAAATDRGYKKDNGSFGGLSFEQSAITAEGDVATRLDIDYPHGYQVEWRYDTAINDYSRLHNGIPQADAANGQQLRASSVVVMFAKNWFIGRDDQQDLTQVGSGKALFFLDGKASEGTWTREALDKPTFFWNSAGERMALNATGTTWLQVVPMGTEVAFD